MVLGKKVGILVVAYNAEKTLGKVLLRIPKEVWQELDEIAIFDDASSDKTFLSAKKYKKVFGEKLKIYKNPHNLGYGGNQKQGYDYFLKKDFDVVVLLHGDGQYAPEYLKKMYMPIVEGKTDAVFGSRMLNPLQALKGRMPLYKFLGNIFLTFIENKVLKMHLSEFHSGYRAYSLKMLSQINFHSLTNDFPFDSQIIIKINHQGFRILEIPIPTFYGKEISYVNSVKYGLGILKTLLDYKMTVSGRKKAKAYSEYFKK